jgi:hypothetical protein
VRRADPFRLSVGDEAVADFGPGLLEFLSLRDGSGERLGETLAPEWVLPISAVGTAAFALVGEEFQPWTATEVIAELRRPLRAGEIAVATVRVASLRRASVVIPFRAVSREEGDLLLEGRTVFACVGPEGVRPFDPKLLARSAPAPAPPAAPGPPSVALPPSPEKTRFADRILPASTARKLRLTYWHLKDLRRAVSEPPPAPAPAASVRWSIPSLSLRPGEAADVELEVRARAGVWQDVEVHIEPPFGYGLEVAPTHTRLRLSPGAVATIPVRVAARRPDEVNLGRPWAVDAVASAGGERLGAVRLEVRAPDPEPGRLFYVLTEDCETFDGGDKTGNYGAARVLGNHNDFMDPEDYRVQMIAKPDALNAIAEKHGARWTHFWTVPQRFATDWAASRSKTGAWELVARELDESIRRGSQRHEYAPHIHFDYEPDSKLPPQPRLLYDEKTDGILPNEYYDAGSNPNHKYHGWDGGRKGIAYVRAEGSLGDPDSKKGSLYRALRHLARLSLESPTTRVARTGAADFGGTPEDLRVSARASLANGILGNSDSGVYHTDVPLPRGRQIYFARGDDLDREVDDLAAASLVELRAPPHQLEQGTLAELNAWFDGRAAESRGPGVRAIVAMTHAMFVRGAPDPFRDVSGGDFDKIDLHLLHVRRAYPQIRFGTASEVTLEFLDYYTPVPLAVPDRLGWCSADGKTAIYSIRILGRGIPIAPDRPARLTVQVPPIAEAGDVLSLAVLEDGLPLAGTSWTASIEELPTIAFEATRSTGYMLRVEIAQALDRPAGLLGMTPGDAPAGFTRPAEDVRPDLFRLEGPRLLSGRKPPVAETRAGETWEWQYPGDLFHLLIHPVAGHAHPLGRRMHPFGRIPEGMAIDVARRLLGDGTRPERFVLKLVRPMRGDADFRLTTVVEEAAPERLVFANRIDEGGVEVARVRLEVARR